MSGTASGEYRSVRQVATRFGVSVKTVYKWIRCGHLKAVKTGPKLWRVPRAAIQALAQQVPPEDANT